jgi:arylsulfatase A-like enzyme
MRNAWLSLTALGLGGLAGCAEAPPAPRDLLLLSIDTLRADALGSYGNRRGTSPFLDDLARRGVRFASAWSHSPKTAPSHMTMMTGLEPRVHGVGNLKTVGSPTLGPEATTLAEVLAAEGYRTAAFTDGGNVQGDLGFARGFELYVARKADAWGPRAGMVREWVSSVPEGQPWFLFFHTYHVHDPYFPPPAIAARFCDPDYGGRIIGDRDVLEAAMATEDLGASFEGHTKLLANYWGRVDHDAPEDLRHLHDLYLASVADLDSKLSRLFGWLEEQGHLDRALVVVTSDHGEEFGEHGDVRHEQLWRELLHVPLMLRFPGDRHAGRVIQAGVRHTDLMASVLELIGLDPGLPDLGESWAPWLEDPALETDRPSYAEHRSRRDSDLDLWALREAGRLLHESRSGLQLFDRVTDPQELAPLEDPTERERLLDAQRRELARLAALAGRYSSGAGTELSDAVRAELEALGYL